MQFIRLFVAVAILAAAPLPGADRLFLFDRDSDAAAVLDAPGLTAAGSANVGQGAFTALRARGRTYVVAASRATVLDDALEHIAEIPFGDDQATAAAIDVHSSNLLVAAGPRLYRIDTQSNQIAATLETGVTATAIHVPANAQVAYLLTSGSRQAKVVELATGTVLPGFVDLAATPGVVSGGFIGAGAEVFSATPLASNAGGVFSPTKDATALLAANGSGATLLQSSSGLVLRAADGTLASLAFPGDVAQSALSPDGKTAYVAGPDGRVTALDAEGAAATAWMASAPTAMALVPGEPEQEINLISKVSSDPRSVLENSTFDIVVKGEIGGGLEMTVVSDSPVAQCDDVPVLFATETPITCTTNSVSSTTTAMLTVSVVSGSPPVPLDSVTFTIFVFPADLEDGLFKISGDDQTVNAGGSFALVVESRFNGGLPNAGTSITADDDSDFVSCPTVGLTTNQAGRATVNCTVSAPVPVSEAVTITVTDGLANSVDFTVNVIGQTGSNDALTKITPDPIVVFEEQSFNITVEATLNGTPQPNVPLTISGGGGVVTCPQQASTGGNGRAVIACGAGPVDADTAVQITITDGSNNVVYTIQVNNSILVNGLQIVSGDDQTVPANTPFPQPLVVRLVENGQPKEGVLLTVTPSNSAATCSVSTLTNQDGLGSITCTAGAVAGITTVEIDVSDGGLLTLDPPFTATITPGSSSGGDAADISIVAGGNLVANVGDTLFGVVQVRTVDDQGTAVASTNVFARGPQGITINPAATQTNLSGLASFDVSFGCAPRTGQLGFGLSSATTEATVSYTLGPGPLKQFQKIQGDSQTGTPGQRLPLALVVESADQCGTILPNIPLTWSVVPADAATLEASTLATNVQGRASTLVRPSARGGAFQVVATSTLDATVTATFSLTTQNAPSQLLILSGDQQTVPANAAAAAPLVVSVLSASSQPVQGVEVGFQITTGAGTLGSPTATTDAQGRASTTFTAGALRGPVTVVATAAGRTVQFNLTVGGGAPQLQTAGFVNGASFRPGFVSGSTGSIFGVNITEGIDGAVAAPYDPSNGFPTLFRGVRVTIAGIAAPILSLANVDGQEQINIQVPFGLPQGVVTVVVENNGTQSSIEGIPIFDEQPGIFEFNSGSQRLAAVLHADFSVVTPSNPARPGEVLQLFVTGMGRLSPPVPTNQAGPASPLANTVHVPTVAANGVEQEVLVSVYAPQLVTVYQINFRLGANTQPGLVEVVVTADGAPSQEASMPVGAAF